MLQKLSDKHKSNQILKNLWIKINSKKPKNQNKIHKAQNKIKRIRKRIQPIRIKRQQIHWILQVRHQPPWISSWKRCMDPKTLITRKLTRRLQASRILKRSRRQQIAKRRLERKQQVRTSQNQRQRPTRNNQKHHLIIKRRRSKRSIRCKSQDKVACQRRLSTPRNSNRMPLINQRTGFPWWKRRRFWRMGITTRWRNHSHRLRVKRRQSSRRRRPTRAWTQKEPETHKRLQSLWPRSMKLGRLRKVGSASKAKNIKSHIKPERLKIQK